MIYAIRALGTEFVKIGFTKSVGKRLKELDTGCPHELQIEAIADWPNEQERAIHQYLADSRHKLEWFKDSDKTALVVNCLKDGSRGLEVFRHTFSQFAKYELGRKASSFITPLKSAFRPEKPRCEAEPIIEMTTDDNATERFEQIRQHAIARKARRQACAA